MSRLKKHANVPTLLGSEPLSGVLKFTDRYSQQPWQPGEIPVRRNGTLIVASRAHDDKNMPYGEFWGVEKPCNHGDGYPSIDIVDLEGNETKTPKQLRKAKS